MSNRLVLAVLLAGCGRISFDVHTDADGTSADAMIITGTGPWAIEAANPLPTPRIEHATVFANGYLYVVGGVVGGATVDDVDFAPVSSDGSVGAWQSATALPFARTLVGAVALDGYLYALGGDTSYPAVTQLNDVISARIQSDGSLGPWQVTTSLPTPRYSPQCVTSGGRLYCLGGYRDPDHLDDVQFATPAADGTLGAWTSTTSFPRPRRGHVSVVVGNALYAIGGADENTYMDDVRSAIIDTDGTVGAWAVAPSLSMGRYRHSATTSEGYIFMAGGNAGGADFADVSFLAATSGSSWTMLPSMPSGRSYAGMVVVDRYLLIVGGRASTPTNEILRARLLP